MYVSYLEIYNDAGYDLLDPARNIHGFEDLPRVSVFEDASSGMALRNLSLHAATDEEAALNLVGPAVLLCAAPLQTKDAAPAACWFLAVPGHVLCGRTTLARAESQATELGCTRAQIQPG